MTAINKKKTEPVMRTNECILDIILVNYKSTDFLLQSLQSIYNDIGPYPINVFVQDNASHDGIERILERFPDVRLSINTNNIGFAKAINNTIKNSCSPYVMIVNPDTVIEKAFFKTMLRYMEQNPDVGIVGPQILNNDGTVQGSARAFPTPLSGFFGRTSFLSKCFPNNWITRNNILTKKINGTGPVEVDWISGACMVIRRSALNDVGLLDERFYMYWEDVDWCRRMWIKGWKVVYYPQLCMYHYVGGSSNRRPLKSLFEFHKSCYIYFLKYKTWPSVILKPALVAGLSSRFLLLYLLLLLRREKVDCKNDKPKILFLITEDWYFWSHRLPLARAARDSGFEVLIATRVHKHKKRIEQEGFRLIPIRLERNSRKLLKELLGFIEIVKIYRKERPDIVHHVANKPVLYGSWAARISRVPYIVNAIAGMGFLFVTQGKKSSLLQWCARIAYKTAFLPDKSIGIFQNPDDLRLFINANILKKDRAVIIRGSGVDTSVYKNFPEKNGIPCVVFASRMLWDKSVGEYIEAAKQIRKRGMDYRFLLIGDPDPDNPMSVPRNKLEQWSHEGIVEWHPHSEEIPKIFADSNIVVLPTCCREGLPKVLLEAASCGRAIVTTDAPGCREIVRDEENGFLIPPANTNALADAIVSLANNPKKRIAMGKRGREIVLNEFAEEIVVQKTMNIYNRFFQEFDQADPLVSKHHLLN